MRRTAVLAAIVVAAVLVPAPAEAANKPFAMTPNRVTSPGTLHLASITPCPAAPDAGWQVVARAQIYRWNGRGFWTSWRPVTADRSWAWDMAYPTGSAPGRYIVQVTCEEVDPDTDGTHDEDLYAYYAYDYQPLTIVDSDSENVNRLAGSDRIATAIAASGDVIDTGKAFGAVIARSDAYADSLAGTPLAAAIRGPLLLTGPANLDQRVVAELNRAIPADVKDEATVFLLGGTAALSPHVEDQLTDLGYQVKRIGGLNRYGTASRIAQLWEGQIDRIFLADGHDWHDGLVAGAAARNEFLTSFDSTVVLLTDGAKLPEETASVVGAHPSARRYAIGAPAAAADPAATPLVGNGPVATAIKVATTLYPSPAVVSAANVSSFADALAGGLHAALKGAPLLFTDAASLSPATDQYLRQNAGTLVAGWVYGGTAAVAEPVRAAVEARINGR